MTASPKTVVVIGGGITGISAAYYLQKHAGEQNYRTVLLESSSRLGGKVQTFTKDGFVIERGPDSFLARKQSASTLIKELGMENHLTHNATGKSYVLSNGKLHAMPGGAIMGIPTQVMPFAFSGLFSPFGKLRAAGDFVLPPSKETGDRSLGTFFRRRLGDEIVENLIEPLLSGIYAGDIDQLSLMATFPQFYQLEQKYGSLVRGMKKSMPKRSKSAAPQPKKGMFLTVNTGLESVVKAVEEKLSPGTVQLNTAVNKIEKQANDQYVLHLSTGKTMVADSVIIAVPHQAAQHMLADYSFMDFFQDMPSTSVATVAMAFPESAIKKDIDGTGFVVSRNSDYTITATTWTHKKWPHTTPEGYALLRCYVGRANDESIVEQSDEVIINTVLRDLNKTMDIDSKPEFTVITRWRDSMPQYTVGHRNRIETMTKEMNEQLPGVFIAGGSYEGLGLPDCIDQGVEAVNKAQAYLNSATS